jgi:hypothetical protein
LEKTAKQIARRRLDVNLIVLCVALTLCAVVFAMIPVGSTVGMCSLGGWWDQALVIAPDFERRYLESLEKFDAPTACRYLLFLNATTYLGLVIVAFQTPSLIRSAPYLFDRPNSDLQTTRKRAVLFMGALLAAVGAMIFMFPAIEILGLSEGSERNQRRSTLWSRPERIGFGTSSDTVFIAGWMATLAIFISSLRAFFLREKT